MDDVKIRIPTPEEWDTLIALCGSEDSKLHWKGIYSWILEPTQKSLMPAVGGVAPQFWYYFGRTDRRTDLGFRPVFKGLPLDIPEGESKIVGTLYMDNKAVCVAGGPAEYLPKAKLKLGTALPFDPDYQVRAIRVGDAYIADRVLVSWISFEEALREMAPCQMRTPTVEEWDKMIDICKESDAVTHWVRVYSWVDDSNNPGDCPPFISMGAGALAPHHKGHISSLVQHSDFSFRPAFDGLTSNAQDGDIVIAGTLYMDNEPVRIPSTPTADGDVVEYKNDAKLEILPPLDDPAYQVKAIKVGNIYIADRVLVSRISYDQILAAIS